MTNISATAWRWISCTMNSTSYSSAEYGYEQSASIRSGVVLVLVGVGLADAGGLR